jgi:hypothetical protein
MNFSVMSIKLNRNKTGINILRLYVCSAITFVTAGM